MSLKPQPIKAVPEETQRIAQAAFPKGNPYMRMRDELGVFYQDTQFATLFSSRGQPALSPWQLALVTIMQFAENLTDRQAADAVRARIDWKYALGLELTDPGFHYSVLSEFRARLIEGNAEHLLLETMLTQFRAHGWLRDRGKQRTDSTHVLAAIRTLNRLELVAETLMHTLNVLATVAPDWLNAWVPEEWFSRYEKRLDEHRLPQEKPERIALAEVIGVDGYQLLSMIYAEAAPDGLASLPAVDIMRQIWLQQYYVEAGEVRWRTSGPGSFGLPPAAVMISSPHDIEARYGSKRNTASGVGYKVHLTETCDAERPHLVTDVQTTVATDPDNKVTAKIHQELDEPMLLPREHLTDSGYGSTDLVLDSRQAYGIDLVCPLRLGTSWQARTEGAFDLSQFEIDWEQCQVTCPQGKTSRYWKQGQRGGRAKILAVFDPADCQACPARAQCTRNRGTRGRPGARELTFGPREEHETLQHARQFQKTEAFKERYAKRAGVEGTISQAANGFSMRHCRYQGLEKTHLQHVLTACAINVTRVVDWLMGKPRAKTRVSPFVALASA